MYSHISSSSAFICLGCFSFPTCTENNPGCMSSSPSHLSIYIFVFIFIRVPPPSLCHFIFLPSLSFFFLLLSPPPPSSFSSQTPFPLPLPPPSRLPRALCSSLPRGQCIAAARCIALDVPSGQVGIFCPYIFHCREIYMTR